jgi:hypothetical protein
MPGNALIDHMFSDFARKADMAKATLWGAKLHRKPPA